MLSTNKSTTANQDLQAALLKELRQMRKDAIRLNGSIVEHLKSFQQDDDSFSTLPPPISKPRSEDRDISIGSTCTALMALLATRTHEQLWSKQKGAQDKTPVNIGELFEEVVRSKWQTSGLPDGNAFTTALVVRTAGLIAQGRIPTSVPAISMTHRRYRYKNEKDGKFEVDETVAGKSLKAIIQSKAKAKDIHKEPLFGVSGYPSKTTIAYWFVDGAINARVDLGDTLREIAVWARNKFHDQLIYVSARNDSLMDPPELAMAACLISRIRRLCAEDSAKAEISRSLPSKEELLFGVKRVLAEQPESGIWHKYFPLFHFPRGGGAADYCFSFEFLEAILTEFGSSVLSTLDLLGHFKRSLLWCDTHDLHYVYGEKEYRGWNSGGEVTTLAAGMPELWATAAVHMFLNQLHLKISDLLDELVLKEEFAKDRLAVERSKETLKHLIDVNVTFPGEAPTTLSKVIRNELLYCAQRSRRQNPFKLGAPRSALFFGPPGTSKTALARAIAEHLGWPIVTITPSQFLGGGLEQVHSQVDKVFRDLMDLRRCVVFFDEMDALAQTREGASESHDSDPLDVTRLLLTTSMLPKLADLWDQAGVIFLMATNHRRHLDPAVTRANRFDLLLCVAPPPWSRKKSADKLKNVLKIEAADEVASKLEQQVDAGSSTERQLDLFTVSELGTFFDHLKRANKVHSLVGALEKYKNRDQFSKEVAAWATNVITLREGTPTKAEYDVDQDADVNASRRQYYRKERKKEKDKKQKPRHNLSKTTGAPKKRRRKRSRTAVRTSKH
jgi:hypothetical protein